MSDDEFRDKVLDRVGEGGFQSLAYLIREIDIDALRDVYDYMEDDEEDEV